MRPWSAYFPLMVGLILMVCAAGATAQESVTRQRELEQLQREVFSLRRDLADVKIKLRAALREIELLTEFLAAEDPQQQIAEWRQQRQALSTERQKLETERRKLEITRSRLLAGEAENAADPPGEAEQPAEPPDNAAEPQSQTVGPRYELDYHLQYIRTEADGQTTYIEFGNLVVPVASTPAIDRHSVMVRGTLQNRSAGPWRYTFEVRIADRKNTIIGRWRYQTPLLQGNELHEFQMKVPVTDSANIFRYQIGNFEIDRPQPEAK